MKKSVFHKYLAVTFLLFTSFRIQAAVAQEVIKHPDAGQSLNKRWQWAINEAAKSRYSNGFWIAYSIEKEMSESSFIGSYSWPQSDQEPSLAEIITGRKITNVMSGIPDDEAVKEEAVRVLDQVKNKDRKVKKDVAFCFYIPSASRKGSFSRFLTSNLSLHVDLEDAPLVWLHRATNRESINFLKDKYKHAETDGLKERLLTAVGIHQDRAMIIPFLTDILRSRAPDELRGKAAFWLGQQDHRDALKSLLKAVHTDHSLDVRKQCVFAISQLDLEEARDALIDLVKNSNHIDIREKAIFWLGQTGGVEVLDLLVEAVHNDSHSDIRESAVFAISQIEEKAAVDALIKIAYDGQKGVRKKAIFWLSGKASKRATQTLEDIAENGGDTEMQKKAVFALYQLPKGVGIPKLIQISKSHKNPEIRKKAIFWLGQSEDERAVDAIVTLLRD